jgi:hypothetical protein
MSSDISAMVSVAQPTDDQLAEMSDSLQDARKRLQNFENDERVKTELETIDGMLADIDFVYYYYLFMHTGS